MSATEFVLSGSNVKCVFNLPEDLWAVEVDQTQIDQVVHNLVINAREAMPEGGDVRVSAENVHLHEDNPFFLRQGRYVKISFEDQGRGIPSEHLERIFDPYFSTKQMGNQRGMGLGLAISHSIIKKHRGHIAVESEVGGGSSFQVYLPVAGKSVGDEVSRPERRSSRKYKILVMDDEKLVRDVVSDVLRNAGFEVFAAENGERAIELYLEASRSDVPFDAVILDLTVKGGMGGREVINKMLQIDPEVKGIVSSGYFDDPSITDFRQFGFKGAIAKPYNVDELEKTIYQVINKDSI
jgi:nitrogen fixation/metabolism regulation signal transduction histidine kinase